MGTEGHTRVHVRFLLFIVLLLLAKRVEAQILFSHYGIYGNIPSAIKEVRRLLVGRPVEGCQHFHVELVRWFTQ